MAVKKKGPLSSKTVWFAVATVAVALCPELDIPKEELARSLGTVASAVGVFYGRCVADGRIDLTRLF